MPRPVFHPFDRLICDRAMYPKTSAKIVPIQYSHRMPSTSEAMANPLTVGIAGAEKNCGG